MNETVTLTVTGMKCGGCEANVSGKLTALDGVSKVTASSSEKEVTIAYDAEKTTLDTIKNTIIGAGYGVG